MNKQPNPQVSKLFPDDLSVQMNRIQALVEENKLLRREIRVSREAAEITAKLVVKQFVETEKILHRYQVTNAQRKAVLNSASQISIIATDIRGTIIVFNAGAENLLGYRANEVIGKRTPLIFHIREELDLLWHRLGDNESHRMGGIDVFFACANNACAEPYKLTYVRKDGSSFPISMSVNSLRDPDGVVSGFLCIARDITENKRSETALREGEKKYRLLVKNLPNIVFKGYVDGSIDFVDNKVETLTGYSRDLFLSRKIRLFDLVVPEDIPAAKAKFKSALKSDGSYIREYRLRAKGGDIIWIEEWSQIIFDKNGKIDFITGAFLDISERKRAEKALHESEEKYRSLFVSGPNPIFVLDREKLEVLDANPAAEETYGFSRDELLGRHFKEFGTSEYEDFGLEIIDRLESEAWKNAWKVRYYKKGDTPLYIKLKGCPTTYKSREAIIIEATDITEMIEKDAQLIQASKMTTLGEMSAGIAHELNQPLNAIRMGSEYLNLMISTGMEIPKDNLLKVAGEVSDQVSRASDIINRLRAFGRKNDFAKQRVDVNKAIRSAIGIIGQPLSLQNIKVELFLKDNLPEIYAHTNRLEQVIFNLLTNARDAIEQKDDADGERLIIIRSLMEKERVVITVSDTGVGLAPAAREKIFEPFFTTKEVGKGMGLGLSIIYGIIRDYQGEISVESEVGKGTTFKQTFPPASY